MHSFFEFFYTKNEDITILRKARKYVQVDATSPPCSLVTSDRAPWERQISLLFIYQPTWHYIPEGINLHKPFILLLAAFIFLSSSSQSPMAENRSAHKATDLWIYDRLSISRRNGPYGCLQSRWARVLFCMEANRPKNEFHYHHFISNIINKSTITINSQITTLLHVSTLSCHLQGARIH